MSRAHDIANAITEHLEVLRAAIPSHFAGMKQDLWGAAAMLREQAAAIERLEAERDAALSLVNKWEAKAATWLASPEAAQRLDGYRELAQRANLAEVEIERLRALATCGCGDQFTLHDPGTCGACIAGITAAPEAQRERRRHEP